MAVGKVKYFRNTLRVILSIILALLLIGSIEAQAAKKTKEYPKRDKELPTYDYVTEVPEIIYSTNASENGLAGNCYCISGTVKGVYKKFSKLCKALKIENVEFDDDSILENAYSILLKTKKGYVVITDIYSPIIDRFYAEYNSGKYTAKEIEDDIKRNKEKYVFFEKYDKLPQKGEKVKIYATYAGFSGVTNTPMFYYGINPMIVDSAKDEKENLSPSDIETRTYKLDNIKLEIPSDWEWDTESDQWKYFYSDDGFMFINSMYMDKQDLDQDFVDMYNDSFIKVYSGLKLISTKKNEYKDKPIKEYYLSSFKGKFSGEKAKVRTTIFEYKGDLYFVGYTSYLTEESNLYFEIYTNIVKSIKPVK